MYTRKGFNTRFRCLWIVSEYEEDYTNRSYHIFVPMYIVITSAGIHADSIFPKRTEAACCSCRASNKKADYNGVNQFDVLLVFMFDRLGRRDDETPFVVQWFVQQGIEVWSTKEGEQRFDNHVNKLLNYIRFWQASGESGVDDLPYLEINDLNGLLYGQYKYESNVPIIEMESISWR